MAHVAPGKCPICGHELRVNRLSCAFCSTKLDGEFTSCKFCRLPAEQREFIEVFIKCRGSIKEVEKELGISYPTVRGRLDAVIRALGYVVNNDALAGDRQDVSAEVLDALDKGEISAAEAARRLRKSLTK
ncbi:MAG: DUF2089 domain-containing protein [Firmicutes bacterium]|nr:DUF2089 domain-containing protein [Bacillota bacterium]